MQRRRTDGGGVYLPKTRPIEGDGSWMSETWGPPEDWEISLADAEVAERRRDRRQLERLALRQLGVVRG